MLEHTGSACLPAADAVGSWQGLQGAIRLLQSTDCLNSCAASMYYHNKSNIQVMSGTPYLVCCASNPVVAKSASRRLVSTLGKVLRFDDFSGFTKAMMICLSVALAACIVKLLGLPRDVLIWLNRCVACHMGQHDSRLLLCNRLLLVSESTSVTHSDCGECCDLVLDISLRFWHMPATRSVTFFLLHTVGVHAR